ncbi:asparagine synthase (glutamine-hydrolyzing) [Allofournierella sp.]|uniref:asparagine synthase (glutamine-hydrolyzing) n=1 Tax=Allofournierella sp. TaxID=1940256 RepID=UPI003AF1C2D8
MCGFVGFASAKHNAEEAKKTVKAMADLIAHRGPDGEGFYVDDRAALGHRRLSIIDLAGGAQPMFNEDGSLVIVYNGEAYNFMELRGQLIAAGHTFATQSDTEVLLHGYEQWGKDLPAKLRGMFAFVIWDKTTGTLFGARDIFGIKPFYYYQNEQGELLFGSEIKSFLPHPGFKKELNEERLPEYLSIEYIPNEETMFKGVYKLPGAHMFTWRAGSLEIERYYNIAYHIDEGRTLAEWEAAITETFSNSVAAHQIADVEVGCFLSSGVDSSFVVNEVAKGTPRVKSFSVGYEEEKYSELPYAQAFSQEIGVPSIANKVSADEFFQANKTIQWYLDEPMPNPSEVPLYFLTQNAAKYVKVVLSGEGADELFGGYPLYCAGRHFSGYAKLPRPLRKAAAALAKKLPDFKGKNFVLRGAQEPWQRCMRANYVFATPAERDKYLKKHYHDKAPEEFFKPYFDQVRGLDEPTQLQWVDMHTWMLYDILLKADRMSMANSLELRVPFLDKEMLELALSIPSRYRAGKTETKIALRRAALGQLPESVAKRKKLGFPVPLNDWLRQDKYYHMVRQAFEGEVAAQFFNVPELLRLLDEHKAGKNGGMTKIWSFYSFILWYEQFFVLR